jgi:hypothetical protein
MFSVRVVRQPRSLVRWARVAPAVVALACAGILSACDVHGVSEPGLLSTLSISPDPQSMAVNGTQQFTATGTDFAGGSVVAAPTWSVVAGGGSISPTGVFTAGTATGTFTSTVKATSGALSATATVVVTAGALASIVVTPTPVSLQPGATQQYTAAGRDAAGNAVAITPSWTVVAGGGTINLATGAFTAGSAAGSYVNTVRASSGSIAGFATVNVVPGALATIIVTPNPDTALVGTSRLFSASGRDASGNAVAISPVWTVTNGGGTIGRSGTFTAGSTTGTFTNTVRATSGTTFGSATVEVVSTLAPSPVSPTPPNINLGSAALNGIMAGTAVTCVNLGVINADISVSPGQALSGFGPCTFTGTSHLGDAVAAQAQLDLTVAYDQLMGLPCPPSNVITANLGGTTKAAGVYCSPTTIGVTGDLVLNAAGDPNAVFVFQAGTGLTTAGNVLLIGGAQAKNVYWVVGSSATLGTASQWQGNVITLTSITLVDNANLLGRALARNGAVTLGTNNTITLP